jgi:DNA-binding Lrp family transcriptional regulator
MTKSSKEQIQEDEMKILTELQKNSKENIDTIAKHCGFSRQKTWKFIKQLENSHKIWGYSAIVDTEKQGLQKFVLFFKHSVEMLDEQNPDQINLDGIKKDYMNLDIKIETSYNIHGDYDWIIIFTAKDILQAKNFINLIMMKYPKLIEKTHLAQILYTPRNHYILNPNPLKVKDFILNR